ncbi:MAG: O-methyltransferase family 2 [Geobacter sp.]|nr:O-methyltransferase family 2 [Geobacter sp.]
MTATLSADPGYAAFCSMITGYRSFMVISEALNSGIIDLLEDGELTAAELLAAARLQSDAGGRFIGHLVGTGLLHEHDGRLALSAFSKAYLSRSSSRCQRHVIAFEPLLMENWSNLGTVLRNGQGTLLRPRSAEECAGRLELFQQAMSETARVRAAELWDNFPALPDRGRIIDIGAGDAVYLREFLARNPGWQGVACDLPDVCHRLSATELPENMALWPCNILDEQQLAGFVEDHPATADILLLSNVCHCFGFEENGLLLGRAARLLTDTGNIIIHDFFRDTGSLGAMYDLHMLVNTYNGRSYTIAETAAMLQAAGCYQQTQFDLPSGSHAIVAANCSNIFSTDWA